MSLQSKNAVITGSTSGIGLAMARALAKEGVNITLNGLGDANDIAKLTEALAKEFGVKVRYSSANMLDGEAIAAMIHEAEDAFGSVDILINNAGIQHVAPIENFPVAEWEKVIGINLNAAFHAMRAVIPGMKARGWGRIISTASAHSLTASAFKSAYVAAKHGLTGLSKAVALEVSTNGITVNCISPAYVWTPLVEAQIPDTMAARNMTREQVINEVMLERQPTKQFVTPEQVAASAVFLCSDAACQMTGSNLVIDGGWTAQ
jgi:3-hydroxybutyrate dehydrogenase